MSATTIVATDCRLCGAVSDIPVEIQGFIAWRTGELIQDALPDLTPAERELLISNTCDECWKQMFPDEDE